MPELESILSRLPVSFLSPTEPVEEYDDRDGGSDAAVEDQEEFGLVVHGYLPFANQTATNVKNSQKPRPSNALPHENGAFPKNWPKNRAPAATFAAPGSLSASSARCPVVNLSIVDPDNLLQKLQHHPQGSRICCVIRKLHFLTSKEDAQQAPPVLI